MPITVTWLTGPPQNSPVAPPAFTSWPDLWVCPLPHGAEGRQEESDSSTPPPIPEKKKNQSRILLLRASERRSPVSPGTRCGRLNHASSPSSQLYFLSAISLVFSVSFFWRGRQGGPASQLHIQVALNQEDKHRSVRLPLRGSGSLKPPQSDRWVEKLRMGAQGRVSGLMGRAPPSPGGHAGHRLTSSSLTGAVGGGTESWGVNAHLSSPPRTDLARTL